MRVDGVGRGGIQGAVAGGAMDSVSKNIRAQILDAQKQLQELAANKELEPEEKMERRKEIQQKITDLNQQLRQHEIELRQEKQQQIKRANENEGQQAEKKSQKAQNGEEAAGLSQNSMEAMISAERAGKQAKVQGSVASAMKARAGVLKSEIEHAGRGAAVERKQESVADIEAKIEEIKKAQAESLNKASGELAKAGKEDREERKAEKEKEKEKADADVRTDEAGTVARQKENESVKGNGKNEEVAGADEVDGKSTGTKKSTEEEAEKEREEEVAAALQAEMPVYRRVDILL